MEFKIEIWTKNKETGYNSIINHIVVNEFNVEEFAISKYLKENTIDDRFEYSAHLNEIID